MIKHSQRQIGSAHLIIIVIIILALLGALGFVFWKNISKTNSTPSITTSSPSPKPASDYLTISDWGIKFKIADALKTTDILNTKEQSKDTPPQTSYAFTTKRIQSLGGACATQPFDNTEILTRTSEKPNATPDSTLINSTAIDSYYYILGAPPAFCTVVDSNGALINNAQVDIKAKSIEVSDRVALKSMIETLQSVKTNNKFLVLADWNVQFQIPAYLGEATYYKHQSNVDNGMDVVTYAFSTKAVEALGQNCANTGAYEDFYALAGMTRSKQQISNDYTRYLNEQPINGYYYYLTGAQSECANMGEGIQVRDRASVMDMLINPIAK
jgi:heme/copper-type cytochrome/quinol oxidase subunit 2